MAMTRSMQPTQMKEVGGIKVATFSIKVETSRAPEFVDISDDVRRCVEDSGVSNGFVVVFTRHTTASIRINENEPLLLEDMEAFLGRISPREALYRHNNFDIRTVNMTEDECPNGHAHCLHLLLGTSENIPLVDSSLQIGRWQSIFLIELDRPREREVLVQVVGA